MINQLDFLAKLSPRERQIYNRSLSIFIGSLVVFGALGFCSNITGGTANQGKQETGHYFLGLYSKSESRIIYTRVPEANFRAHQRVEALLICFLPVTVGSWCVGFYLQGRGKRRLRQSDSH